MSGRAFEKNIVALSANTKNTSTKNKTSGAITENDTLKSTTKRRLWMLNNLMSLFHTAFCVVTLVVGKLNLAAPIYKIVLSANQSILSVPDWSNYSLSNITDGWDDALNAFLSVTTEEQTFSLYMTWLVAIFFFLSAFFHFGNANLWNKHYISYLEIQQSPFRWIEYTFSASVMILIVGYGAGVRIDVELFMLFVLIATTMFFGHLTETINKQSKTEDAWTLPLSQRLTPHLMGYLPQISAWVVILYVFLSNSEGAPEFVSIIVWTELALFFSFGFVQLAVLLRKPSKYIQGEFAYQVLSLVSKGLLGIIMLVNVIFLGSWTCIVPALQEKMPQGYC